MIRYRQYAVTVVVILVYISLDVNLYSPIWCNIMVICFYHQHIFNIYQRKITMYIQLNISLLRSESNLIRLLKCRDNILYLMNRDLFNFWWSFNSCVSDRNWNIIDVAMMYVHEFNGPIRYDSDSSVWFVNVSLRSCLWTVYYS
jgi:hypothetical protein